MRQQQQIEWLRQAIDDANSRRIRPARLRRYVGHQEPRVNNWCWWVDDFRAGYYQIIAYGILGLVLGIPLALTALDCMW